VHERLHDLSDLANALHKCLLEHLLILEPVRDRERPQAEERDLRVVSGHVFRRVLELVVPSEDALFFAGGGRVRRAEVGRKRRRGEDRFEARGIALDARAVACTVGWGRSGRERRIPTGSFASRSCPGAKRVMSDSPGRTGAVPCQRDVLVLLSATNSS
jgi:hypothetical protein